MLDVADDGDDDSVLSFFDGRFLYRMERLQARDTVQLAQQALKMATEEGCTVLIYDSVGVGSGVKGELNKYEDSEIEFRKFVAQGEVLAQKVQISRREAERRYLPTTCERRRGGRIGMQLTTLCAG